ncbi:MAG: DNA mismatch repair endonuclease MutL [Candidatus Omnitrophica bacterium]|nr:DNA mismatch repair endonuclease MutL [Candidatus Omnitrophota bacterium]
MGKINFLPDALISRIAAGEVVERPASVVKELVENSADAGAHNIIVGIESAGKKLISVKDDGEGIDPDDIEKLFNRHATSKVSGAEDLDAIKSLGFRGEALYSIGAVADVVLKSKSRESGKHGKEIHVRGGKNLGIKKSSQTEGTVVEARELFFNVPARKKFLKSDSAEMRRILSVFMPYAIAFYDKRFSLSHNGRNSLNFNPSDNSLSRFSEVANADRKSVMFAEKEMAPGRVSFRVLLGDINLKRPGKDMQYIFINNRPVFSQSVSYSVNQVYREIFPREVYPVFAVFLKIPFEEIDVNIHPAKREVKLKDEYLISSALADFCREVLFGRGKAAEAVKKSSVYFEMMGKLPLSGKNDLLSEGMKPADIFQMRQTGELPADAVGKSIRERLRDASYIGCYRNKYLFFESGESLLAIDQHAAHERINYELLKKQFETGKLDIQRVLTPLIIKLNAEEFLAWEEGAENLENAGFLTTRWDSGSIALHGFLQVIKDPEASVRSLLAERNIDKCDKETLARRACKGSVVAGAKIQPEEAVHIKNELLKCVVPFTCPHGRPTVVEFTESFFDRQFLR